MYVTFIDIHHEHPHVGFASQQFGQTIYLYDLLRVVGSERPGQGQAGPGRTGTTNRTTASHQSHHRIARAIIRTYTQSHPIAPEITPLWPFRSIFSDRELPRALFRCPPEIPQDGCTRRGRCCNALLEGDLVQCRI